MELDTRFTDIYKYNKWAEDQNESKSGMGSTLQFTENIRNVLLIIVDKYNIKNMIDTSCGDWNWMKLIKDRLSCNYIGIDIVKDVVDTNMKLYSSNNVTFINIDFLSFLRTLPDKSVDLILCRHTCEHLPTQYVIDFIKECKRVTKHLLLTTHSLCQYNVDLTLDDTYRPINLNLEPYYDLLKDHFVEQFYDGPLENKRYEMNICFYKF